MYQFSRAIYRELAPEIGSEADRQEALTKLGVRSRAEAAAVARAAT